MLVHLLVAAHAGCWFGCWLLGWKKTSIVSIAPRRIGHCHSAIRSIMHLGPGACTGRGNRGENETKFKNGKTKVENSKLTQITMSINDERPRPPRKEPIGILYIILFRFAFSRAVSGLQATEGLSRGSLALGEPEAEATNGTADGPGTQRLPPLTPLVRIQITEAAHNAEGTSQRAHGSPCTPARTLRGNARTTHAKWIFIRIQHADDA